MALQSMFRDIASHAPSTGAAGAAGEMDYARFSGVVNRMSDFLARGKRLSILGDRADQPGDDVAIRELLGIDQLGEQPGLHRQAAEASTMERH